MTVDERIAELAVRQHGLVAEWQLRTVGTRAEVRHRRATGRLQPLRPGVFLAAGAPKSTLTHVMASVLAAGTSAWASHETMASLYGLPGYRARPVDVTVLSRRRPLAGIRLHYSKLLPTWQQRLVKNIPATSVARTLFDLCAMNHPKRAERALDNAVARRMVTIPACWRVLDHLREHGRSGSALMRELLEARGEGYVAPASELERVFLGLVRAAHLPEPAREIDLGDPDGWVGRVEFVYRDQRVLIEIDSRTYHTALLDRDADRQRDNRFNSARWHVLRFDWADLTERPDEVTRLVRRALEPRGLGSTRATR